MIYKLLGIDPLTNQLAQCIHRSDGVTIPMNPDNTDYQAYLAWVAEGNTPTPADEQGVA